jgi:hypothetical protein
MSPNENRPCLEARCAGNPAEMGFAQGAALRAKIHGAHDILRRLEVFRERQPCCMPYLLYRWLAEKKSRRLLHRALVSHYPEMARRLDAMVEGAQISPGALSLLNILEPFLSSVGGLVASPAACSAVAVRGGRSATGEPVIARNFDYLPLVQPFFVLRECRPAGRFRSLDFTLAPLGGAVDGMNEKGLCLTYNYAFAIDQPPSPAPSVSMIISETLERCSTVAEALAWIETRPRWGGALLMLADADGDIASLEIGNTRTRVRRPPPGEDLLFHTNRFWTPEMRAVEPPEDAVFTGAAPGSMRGRRLHESAGNRDARLKSLLVKSGPLDEEGLRRVMADHGADGLPSGSTPCVHGEYWHTTASLQYFPRSRRLRAAFTTPCKARYETFGL